jgi:hypothetical protein
VTAVILPGLNGANPLGFMASLGLLRLLASERPGDGLGFLADGSFHAFVEGPAAADLAALVERDASTPCGAQSWWLEYGKHEKRGEKTVADLKAPPHVFRGFLDRCLRRWSEGDDAAAAYAAAFGTDAIVDKSKGNTKPTAFHFTAANQQFLRTLEEIRASVTCEWTSRSLFEGHAARPGQNLRWDPAAERSWALMASNPNTGGTSVDAPLEWLAFRALPLFPTMPSGTRAVTTCVDGRGDAMRFMWPLWSIGVPVEAVRSILQIDWDQRSARTRLMQGVFAICSSQIRRTGQGFGSFGPAAVSA